MQYNAEQLAAAHIKIRDARRDLKRKFDEQDQVLKAQFDVVNEAILAMCNELGQNGAPTNAGTIIRKITTRYWASDWSAMKQFIKEHDALDLFEQRLNQGNMAQFLRDNPGVVPMGLNTKSEYTISVRRPDNK